MGKLRALSFILPFLVCVLAAKSSQAYVESSSIPKDWRASLGLGKERLTNLHFFFHDRVNETSVQVASAPTTANSSTAFGTVAIADEPLTESPDPKSEEVGRAQGILALAGRDELKLVMALSFSFSKGKFNGSSLSMLSENPVTHPVRELAIVGGTGKFRLARGVAVARTVKIEMFNAIVEYHVKVIHY